MGDFYGLVVGVSHYHHFPPLLETTNDVAEMVAILRDPQRGAYTSVQSLFDDQATKPAIMDSLEKLARATDIADATVIFYFSGHGGRAVGAMSSTYLCPIEANLADPQQTMISAAEFNLALKAIRAPRKVVILDSCYSNGMTHDKAVAPATGWQPSLKDEFAREVAQASGSVVMVSSRADQKSYTYPAAKMSLFSYYLAEGLRGKAVLHNDGFVRVLDVFHYASETIRREQPYQEPLLAVTDLNLNFPLVRAERITTIFTSYITPIRTALISAQPMKGADALLAFLRQADQSTLERADVDLPMIELITQQLRDVERGLWRYGSGDPHRRALKSEIIYKLLMICQKLELAYGNPPDKQR